MKNEAQFMYRHPSCYTVALTESCESNKIQEKIAAKQKTKKLRKTM